MLPTLLLAHQLVYQFDVTVDATTTRPISPYIYGANQPDWDAAKVNYTLTRQGGNRMTAYNWETNASNAGNDYHHQNDSFLGESSEPGWTVRTYLQPSQQHGAASIVTVPCAGYVSADKNGAGDVNQTPDYIHKRFLPSKPSKPGGKYQYPPDTKDGVVYQDEMVAWVEKTKSPAAPVWYSLDNEPDLWHSTHARLWPVQASYAQFLQISTDYASAIKQVAPKSLVFGPASYGWQGFRTFQDAKDGNGRDFLDFYLSGMKATEAKVGHRVLDVLDVHWYPEAQGVGQRITTNEDKGPAMDQARMQAPRSLWDKTYVEQSWIADSLGKKPIVLMDYLKQRVDRSYPGTKLAITEYHYGGGQSASGTVAQADVLGIFGRYGLFAACNWGTDSKEPAILAAFNAYLNFDGHGSRFADTSVAAGFTETGKPGDAARASVHASRDTKNPKRWVFVLVNRVGNPGWFTLPFDGTVSAYTADPKNPHAPREAKVERADKKVKILSQSSSVTTVEVILK